MPNPIARLILPLCLAACCCAPALADMPPHCAKARAADGVLPPVIHCAPGFTLAAAASSSSSSGGSSSSGSSSSSGASGGSSSSSSSSSGSSSGGNPGGTSSSGSGGAFAPLALLPLLLGTVLRRMRRRV
jgi:hypothetical protein